ncbi:MAG: hypothetical protein ACRDQF_07575 [Thermocrispum sp.]
MHTHPKGRRRFVKIAGVLLASVLSVGLTTGYTPGTESAASGSGAADIHQPRGWVGTWAASPMAPTPLLPNPAVDGFDNQTVRNVVSTSIGGDAVRIRLSNSFGEQPLRVEEVTVAVQRTGATVIPSTVKSLTFSGARSVTVPVGA